MLDQSNMLQYTHVRTVSRDIDAHLVLSIIDALSMPFSMGDEKGINIKAKITSAY